MKNFSAEIKAVVMLVACAAIWAAGLAYMRGWSVGYREGKDIQYKWDRSIWSDIPQQSVTLTNYVTVTNVVSAKWKCPHHANPWHETTENCPDYEK